MRATVEARFAAKYEVRPSGCWEWTGYRSPEGYGRITVEGRSRLAHRIAYGLHVGPIPEGLSVLHRCDNPPCVNPAHLFTGTHTDNMRDMIEKGRKASGHGVRNSRARMTPEQVLWAREQVAAGATVAETAARLGFPRTTIDHAVSGYRWPHLPGALDRSRSAHKAAHGPRTSPGPLTHQPARKGDTP